MLALGNEDSGMSLAVSRCMDSGGSRKYNNDRADWGPEAEPLEADHYRLSDSQPSFSHFKISPYKGMVAAQSAEFASVHGQSVDLTNSFIAVEQSQSL